MTNPEAGFEIEVASIEELLKLLEEREEEGGGQGEKSFARRAVFVSQMMDSRPSTYGFPLTRRYVVAAFAYGRDRISYTRTTSNAVELPENVTRAEDRQQASYEEMRAQLERGLESLGLHVPVCEGFLRHLGDGE